MPADQQTRQDTLLATALAFHDAGCCVIPAATDGSKRPFGAWKTYQRERPTRVQVARWAAAADGIGVICGAVSGDLEMFELEGRAVAEGLLTALADALVDHGFADLFARLSAGYLEQTPSGGLHWLYRVDGSAVPNVKLARRLATGDELAVKPDEKIKVLIETRGEGGFTIIAPSGGRTHDEGGDWTLLRGGPDTIPTISVEERDALHVISTMFDALPTDDPEPPKPASKGEPTGQRPGDDYNARTSWAEILTPRGWTLVHDYGTAKSWRRPGKNVGISATTGRNDADNLYVFSTSTEFDPEKPYSKFAAYALLEHRGDYTAAARALRSAGYGEATGSPPAEVRDLTDLTGPRDTPTAVAAPDGHSLTDDGNALRLVAGYADRVRYVPQRGQWLTWNGHRWVWDEAEIIHEHAREVARQLPATDKAERAHRQWSLSTRGVRAMVRLAQSDPRIVANLAALDAQPYQLNTPSGVVDLRTGTVSAPDPDSLLTRCTAVAPDPGAQPARWLAFLADTFAGDPDMTTYVQRLLGVSLVGTVLEQILPFAYGEGANGKTTLLGTIARIIGVGDMGYAISAPAELLLATTNTGHPTEIARLAGARLVVTSELDEGQRFAEAKVKLLTGRDTITGRFMRQDWFSFTPTHTLWLLGNHQPSVRAGGPAFWRRLRLVPFLHTVPADRRDPHLEDVLVHDEGPAILAWLIQGAADYFAHGLTEPTSVAVATDAYAHDQDTVARFVEDMCSVDTSRYVRVADLRAAYEKWCAVEGEQPVSAKALTLALRSRYDATSERDNTTRFYRGIGLKNLSPDPADPSPDPSPDTDEWWQK